MDKKDAANNNGTPPTVGPPPAKIPEPVNPQAQQPATAAQLQETQNEMSIFERATLRWSQAAVVIAFLAVVFVFLQWRVMDNQLRVMDNQLTYIQGSGENTAKQTDKLIGKMSDQAKATNRLAGAAENSARIADNALQKSQESAALERRPWLGFNFTDNSVESGGYLRVNLIGIMTNTGKTPAVGIEKRVFFIRRYNSNTKGFDIDNLHKAYYAQDGMEFPAHESWTIDDIMDTRERYNPIQRIDDVWPVIAVAPPNSIVHFPVMRDVNIKIYRPDKIDPYDRKGVFIHIVGEFSYYDTPRTKKYKTGFCIERDFEEDFPRFRPCSFGGWYMEDDKQSETRK